MRKKCLFLAMLFLMCLAQRGEAKNVVVIMVDDLDFAVFNEIRNQHRALDELAKNGFSFENAFTSYPLCTPARVSYMRGQRPNRHGVEGNDPDHGGYAAIREKQLETRTLATLLHEHRVRTAHFGKYANNYQATDPVPPGYDVWVASIGFSYTNNDWNNGGRAVRVEEYQTNFLAEQIAIFLRQQERGKPFYLEVMPAAPHTPATPPAEYAHSCDGLHFPRDDSFNTVSTTMPSFIRTLLPLSDAELERIDSHFRERVCSMMAVDDLFKTIQDLLAEQGLADETMIIFTTDHGFHQPQHRLKHGKDTPYDHDIHIPLIISLHGSHGKSDSMVLTQDLAPTIADYLGIEPYEFMDGRSFLPELRGEQKGTRQAMQVMRLQNEPDHYWPAAYKGFRTKNFKFIRYENDEEELYDLVRDPSELNNLVQSVEESVLENLRSYTDQLFGCFNFHSCSLVEDRLIESPIPAKTAVSETTHSVQ